MAKHLITSALPYINGVKHLGNLTGSLLPADVYARFLRQSGEEVLYICATDEHGTPAEISAHKSQMAVPDYCDMMYEKQAQIYSQFGLQFDYFGRTSSVQNAELTQHMYQKLDENNFLEEREISQVYSLADKRYLPDRYIEGTCPKCGYEAARGDQCENCTSVLDPTDLLSPRSALSGSTDLEIRQTKHLFFQIDKLVPKLTTWIESHPNWPKLTTSIALKWIKEGLTPRCITRDLNWGVSVPRDGFEDKVFYVWFDAPIGYVGATKEWADQAPNARDWRKWWYEADDVSYTQFMAKDNVPFHTIFWPATILATHEPWKQATQIKSFNWLNFYGGKFSTSQQRGVFMDEALETLPADYWRYFLISQSPESSDVSFTWELFASVINKDLVGTFGNFVNRVLKLTSSKLGDKLPSGGSLSEREARLLEECRNQMGKYTELMSQLEFRKSMLALRELWSIGNLYLDETAPWSLLSTDPQRAAVVLRTAINLIRIFAIAAKPVIPFTVEKVFKALNLPIKDADTEFMAALDLEYLTEGDAFEVPDLLFQRIDDEQIQSLTERFGGAAE